MARRGPMARFRAGLRAMRGVEDGKIRGVEEQTGSKGGARRDYDYGSVLDNIRTIDPEHPLAADDLVQMRKAMGMALRASRKTRARWEAALAEKEAAVQAVLAKRAAAAGA